MLDSDGDISVRLKIVTAVDIRHNVGSRKCMVIWPVGPARPEIIHVAIMSR